MKRTEILPRIFPEVASSTWWKWGDGHLCLVHLCICFQRGAALKITGLQKILFFMEFRGSWMFCSCSFFENCLIVWITENGMVIFCSKLEDLFERFRTALLLETIGSLCLEESPFEPPSFCPTRNTCHTWSSERRTGGIFGAPFSTPQNEQFAPFGRPKLKPGNSSFNPMVENQLRTC